MDNELANQKRSQFSAKDKAMLSAGLGFCMFMLAVMEWAKTSLPPYMGRWAWTHRIAFEAFGYHGVAVMWIIFGVILSAIALWNLMTMKHSG
ncbi:MAG: hypothetical protein V4625_11905 [Pseudomonadota bacterium]